MCPKLPPLSEVTPCYRYPMLPVVLYNYCGPINQAKKTKKKTSHQQLQRVYENKKKEKQNSSVCNFLELWVWVLNRASFRDRSKFTGYLGRVLGKICLKKSRRPPFLSLKKVFAPLIFSKKKSSPPFF